MSQQQQQTTMKMQPKKIGVGIGNKSAALNKGKMVKGGGSRMLPIGGPKDSQKTKPRSRAKIGKVGKSAMKRMPSKAKVMKSVRKSMGYGA